MNYLAHLYFAKPTTYSMVGNLMGDFMKGVDITELPTATAKGVLNHRLIDKYTDNHPIVRQLKPRITTERRRFAGLIIDVAFDHFLARHWQQYHSQPLPDFCQQVYDLLNQYPHSLPGRMPRVVESMSQDDWLSGYHRMQLTGQAIDSIAKRIRFNNNLAGAISEVELHYQAFEQAFLTFFPQLQAHVQHHNIEQ
ncbi:ACP phosphodiesterase [Thalassotalea maritima]|uniref:acyl carrier protein phosphodiesterase n=1 Tax=Thalassotalea maritima TaxID=3242416 RepID=UPI003529C618